MPGGTFAIRLDGIFGPAVTWRGRRLGLKVWNVAVRPLKLWPCQLTCSKTRKDLRPSTAAHRFFVAPNYEIVWLLEKNESHCNKLKVNAGVIVLAPAKKYEGKIISDESMAICISVSYENLVISNENKVFSGYRRNSDYFPLSCITRKINTLSMRCTGCLIKHFFRGFNC